MMRLCEKGDAQNTVEVLAVCLINTRSGVHCMQCHDGGLTHGQVSLSRPSFTGAVAIYAKF